LRLVGLGLKRAGACGKKIISSHGANIPRRVQFVSAAFGTVRGRRHVGEARRFWLIQGSNIAPRAARLLLPPVGASCRPLALPNARVARAEAGSGEGQVGW